MSGTPSDDRSKRIRLTVEEQERHEFWAELPEVRIVTAHPDGSLTGYERVAPQMFGGHIPNVGDVVGDVWGSHEYDFQVVQRRYFIREFEGDSYWLLVMRDAGTSPQFDNVSENVLLVTDLYTVMADNTDPADRAKRDAEILARIGQLGSPATATRQFKPKPRHP